MELIHLPASVLRHLHKNPRRVKDPEGVSRLKILIQEHGFQNPLQVFEEADGLFTILCGNHRFQAGVELGMTEFPAIVYQGDRDKAIARAISDNKSNEWTEWDIPLLKDVLTDIDTGGLDMELTGFSLTEIEDLFDEGSGGGGAGSLPQAAQLEPEKEYCVISCGNGKEWGLLQILLGLSPVRRGGYRQGSPFDAVGTQRVVSFSDFLGSVEGIAAAGSLPTLETGA